MLRSSLLLMVLLLFGCNNTKVEYNLLASENNQIINYQLDYKLNLVKQTNKNYNINLVHPSFYTKEVVEIVEGLKKRELTLFNLINNKTKEISEAEDNPIVFFQTAQFIYHSSNYVNNNYLKIYDLSTGTNTKIALKDYLVNTITKDQDDIYLIVSTYNDDQNYLIKITNNKIVSKIKLDYYFDSSNNIIIKDNKLLYTYQDNHNYLISLDLNKKQITKQKLLSNVNILKEINGNIIAYQRDLINNDIYNNKIEDITNKKIIEFNEPIKEIIALNKQNMLISENKLYLLDDDLKIIQETNTKISGDIISLNQKTS